MEVTRSNETKVTFSIALIFFWLKGYISVDNNMIKTSKVNTIFGFIPAGRDEQTFALRNVQGSSKSASYKPGNFVLGLILIIIGFNMGIIWILIGIPIFLGGALTSITIDGNGSQYKIEVPFFEKQKIIKINEAIQQAVIYRENKTENAIRETSSVSTDAIVNAINSKA